MTFTKQIAWLAHNFHLFHRLIPLLFKLYLNIFNVPNHTDHAKRRNI
jgi:hypothetical protein